MWLASKLNQRIAKTIIRMMPLTLSGLVLMYEVYHSNSQAQQQLSPPKLDETAQKALKAKTEALLLKYKTEMLPRA